MTPQEIKKPELVTLTVTLREVDVMLASMGTQPFDHVAPLIGSIRSQVVEQIAAFNQPANDGKKDEDKQ